MHSSSSSAIGNGKVKPGKSSALPVQKRASSGILPPSTVPKEAVTPSRRASAPAQSFPTIDSSMSTGAITMPRPRATPSISATRRPAMRTSVSASVSGTRRTFSTSSTTLGSPFNSTTPASQVLVDNSMTTGTQATVVGSTPIRKRVKSTTSTPASPFGKVKVQSSPNISTTIVTPPGNTSPMVNVTTPTPVQTPQRKLQSKSSLTSLSPAARGMPRTPPSLQSTPRSRKTSAPLTLSALRPEQPKLLVDSPAMLSPSFLALGVGFPAASQDSPDGKPGLFSPPSVWGAGDEDDDLLEMITEDGEGEGDEELADLLSKIRSLHTSKILAFKRLLERSQFSNAAQLHALQAEISMLRAKLSHQDSQPNELLINHSDGLCFKCGGPKHGYWSGARSESEDESDGEGVMDAEGVFIKKGKRYTYNEKGLRRTVKTMKKKDRVGMIAVILDCMHPSSLRQQIDLLQHHLKSSCDIIGSLSQELVVQVVKHLGIKETVALNRVSKRYHSQIRHNPYLWKYLCLELTKDDPVKLRPPLPESDPSSQGWYPLYLSLSHLAHNLQCALPQSILFMNGHSGFVTSLMLKERRLISGSYDETIRFWDLPDRPTPTSALNSKYSKLSTGPLECKKVLKVGKVVSCVDWLIEEEVFVVGFHDVGRVHLFSSLTYTPLQQLAGHLNGIRAVALSSKNLVSAGADKALVCWDWRAGTKIVRFGQQTTINIGVQIIAGATRQEGERVVSVTIDGVVRVFSIQRREMVSQFKLSELGGSDPVLSSKLFNVGATSNTMLQWFAAKGSQMTCATKSVILHLQWQEEDAPQNAQTRPTASRQSSIASVTSPTSLSPSPTLTTFSPTVSRNRTTSSLSRSTSGVKGRASLGTPNMTSSTQKRMSVGGAGAALAASTSSTRSGTPVSSTLASSVGPGGLGNVSLGLRAAILTAPPKVVAIVETPDVAVGAVDPAKRRVVTATRFSSRLGADRRMFMSTHLDKASPQEQGSDEPKPASTVLASKDSNVDYSSVVTPLTGVWSALGDASGGGTAKGLIGSLPAKFQGLSTPEKNPMSMQLSHEEVVVGCADGTIYMMNFVGYDYQKPKERSNGSTWDTVSEPEENYESGDSDSD